MLTEAVVRVGDGRGFIVENAGERLIITAAHCLPQVPPCHPARHLYEYTYPNLVGALGATPAVWALDATPTVCVECRFADVMADLAILGAPDNQAYDTQADDYEAFVATPAMVFTTGPTRALAARWMLNLEGRWVGYDHHGIKSGNVGLARRGPEQREVPGDQRNLDRWRHAWAQSEPAGTISPPGGSPASRGTERPAKFHRPQL